MNSKPSTDTYGLTDFEAPKVTRAVARLEYETHGTLSTSIPRAVTLFLNGKEAAILDVPAEIGEWSKRFDIDQFLVPGRTNEIQIAVKTYNFEPQIVPGRIVTNAAVRIYVGATRIFSESYSTVSGYRESLDNLRFNPSHI